jgi:N-acetylmuramoyl-L-alanine amidase
MIAPRFIAQVMGSHRRVPVRGFRRPALVAGLVAALAAGIGITPLAAQDPPRPPKVTVQPGDTLSALAVRFYGSPDAVERILAANKLASADLILSGTTLVLPAPEAPRPATTAPGARQVTIEAGETLSSISQRVYGTPAYASAIAALNNIGNPNLVQAGTRLTVPASPPALPAGTASAPAAGGPLAGRRICLDAGHGGAAEPGSVFDFGDGKILREADVTLDIVRTLRAWLQADGATVILTRNDDSFVELSARAATCNAAAADIAVSIHNNGGPNPAWNGALTLFAKAIDRRLAEALIATLQPGLSKNAPSRPFTAYGAQPFEGAVLLQTVMPAVIVEPVFISNPFEAQALMAPTGVANSRRNQIVLETYRGIRAYFAGGQ